MGRMGRMGRMGSLCGKPCEAPVNPSIRSTPPSLPLVPSQVVVNASLGQTSDPLAMVRSPARCHDLLRNLLELIQRARREQPALRVQLYGCLLQYMQVRPAVRTASPASHCCPHSSSTLIMPQYYSPSCLLSLPPSHLFLLATPRLRSHTTRTTRILAHLTLSLLPASSTAADPVSAAVPP